jgi:hypothetical protein
LIIFFLWYKLLSDTESDRFTRLKRAIQKKQASKQTKRTNKQKQTKKKPTKNIFFLIKNELDNNKLYITEVENSIKNKKYEYILWLY